MCGPELQSRRPHASAAYLARIVDAAARARRPAPIVDDLFDDSDAPTDLDATVVAGEIDAR